MKVILDTNIFHADFRMEGNAFRVFSSGLRRIGGSLIVPQVVVDELVHRQSTEVRRCAVDIGKAASRWRRLTGSAMVSPFSADVVDEASIAYAQWLGERLKGMGATITPYPTVPHAELAKRAMQHRRPFQDSGAGYRDALIWETVKGHCGSNEELVCFVSTNGRDFGDGPKVHPHLQEDLLGAGHQPDRVTVLPSLRVFNDTYVVPRLEHLDNLLRRFATEAVPEFSLEHWGEWEFGKLLRDEDLGATLLGVNADHVRARFSSMIKPPKVNVEHVWQLPNEDDLLMASLEIECEVDLDGDPWAYYQHQVVRDLWGEEPPTEDASVWIPVKATVAVSLTLASGTLALLSAEVDGIEGEWGVATFNERPSRSR